MCQSHAARRGRALLVLLALFGLIAGVIVYAKRGAGDADATAGRPEATSPRATAPPQPSLDEVPTDLRELCEWLQETDNPYFGREAHRRKERELAQAEASGDRMRHVFALQVVAQSHLIFGRNEEGAALLHEALELAAELDVEQRVAVRRQLAIAYLRAGETTHCINHHNPERCLFPIIAQGVWDETEPATRAIEQLELALAEDPDSAMARWLLNIAHMARGTYPQGVPAAALIDVQPNEPDLEVPLFADLGAELGLDHFDLAGGAILEDLDGDGFLDVVTTSLDPCGPLRYAHNEGDGTFADWTERAGLGDQLGGLNTAQGDANGDGRLDLFVFRGAWLGPIYGAQPNSLLIQRADGSFEDVSQASGVAAVRRPCATGAWQDYDRDGDLDIYVAGEVVASQLLRNEGDGTFVDVAVAADVLNERLSKGVAWGDFDEDGDADLYVSNLGGANRLYRNDGGDRFTDVAAAVGADLLDETGASLTFATWFFDYDNDGRLDLYASGFSASLDGFARDYVGQPCPAERLHLLRNVGGRFEPVAEETGLARVHLPMGANYGDIDNDGWLDIYLGTGKPGYEFLVPNALYKNVGGERFVDVTTQARVGHLQKGHGVAFGDVDNDGDQDLFAQMGGFYAADAFHNAFFVNRLASDNRWVTLCLRGADGNRFGVGARVRVDLRTPAGDTRSVHVLCGSGGSFGASSLQQEIGLGDAVAIERVEVRWPSTGASQVFEGLEPERFYELREGDPQPVPLERLRVDLGD